jgi:hypothetical protein
MNSQGIHLAIGETSKKKLIATIETYAVDFASRFGSCHKYRQLLVLRL